MPNAIALSAPFRFTRQCSVVEYRNFVSALRARSNEFERATEDNVYALLAEIVESSRDMTSLDADILVSEQEFLPPFARVALMQALSDNSTMREIADALPLF